MNENALVWWRWPIRSRNKNEKNEVISEEKNKMKMSEREEMEKFYWTKVTLFIRISIKIFLCWPNIWICILEMIGVADGMKNCRFQFVAKLFANVYCLYISSPFDVWAVSSAKWEYIGLKTMNGQIKWRRNKTWKEKNINNEIRLMKYFHRANNLHFTVNKF